MKNKMCHKIIKTKRISPSTLTFMYYECKRCFWLYYNRGLKRPGVFPRVLNHFHKIAEIKCKTKTPYEMLGINRKGRFVRNEYSVKSEKKSNYIISGKLDTLIKWESGTYSVVDFKTQPEPKNHIDLYKNQPTAYGYCLHKKIDVESLIIASLWPNIDGSLKLPLGSYEFDFNKNEFEIFFENVIKLLDSAHIPEPGNDCKYCQYVSFYKNEIGQSRKMKSDNLEK